MDTPSPYRLLRGGSWLSSPWFCRLAFRVNYHPDDRFSNIGFRIVSPIAPPSMLTPIARFFAFPEPNASLSLPGDATLATDRYGRFLFGRHGQLSLMPFSWTSDDVLAIVQRWEAGK